MSRKKRNESIKTVLSVIGVTWKDLKRMKPPKELTSFVETTTKKRGKFRGLGLKKGTFMGLWPFRAIQEKNPFWGDWIIVSILLSKTHVELLTLMSHIGGSDDPEALAEFREEMRMLRGHIRVLLKDIRTPQGLKELYGKSVMGWLSGGDLFEALYGIEIERFQLEMVVTDILISRRKSLTAKQKEKLLMRLITNERQYMRALNGLEFNSSTKNRFMHKLYQHYKGDKTSTTKPYGS